MDFFKCSLCSNSYNNDLLLPRMMPDCGHTFCTQCIAQRLAIGQVICPEDDLTYRNLNQIDDFPVNTTLVSILKKKLNSNSSSSNSFLSPNQKRSDYKQAPKLAPNKSFEIKPQRSQDIIPKNQQETDDELKNLLTPSDFLKNLLGSIKIQQEQQQQPYQNPQKQKPKINIENQKYEPVSIYQEEQPKYLQKSQSNNDKQSFQMQKQSPQTQPKYFKPLSSNNSNSDFQIEDSLQNTKSPQFYLEMYPKEQSSDNKQNSYIDDPNDNQVQRTPIVTMINSINQNSNRNSQKNDQLRQAIIENKVKLEDQIKKKFGEQIDKLQTREAQVLLEINNIFEGIAKRFEDRVDQLEQLQKVCSKVSLEFQLQLELIIPRYCMIRNHINPAKDYEQELPSFAPSMAGFQEPIKSSSSSEREQRQQPQSFTVNKDQQSHNQSIYKDSSPALPNPSSRFNNSFQKINKTEPSEYDFPSFHNKNQFANDNWNSAQKQPRVSPARRIFDDPQPMSKPLQVVNKNQGQDSNLDTVINKLHQGINMEDINLKDQRIGDLQIQQLSEAIKKTVSFVRSIKLSRNKITDNGLQNLLHAINSNKTIKTLNLKKNKLTENTLDLIIKTYQYGKTNYLSQLYLKGNQISVQKHIAKLTTIQQLGIVIYL